MSILFIIFHFKSLPLPHNQEARQHFLTQTEIYFHYSCQSKYKSWSRLIVSFSQLLNPCIESYFLASSFFKISDALTFITTLFGRSSTSKFPPLRLISYPCRS